MEADNCSGTHHPDQAFAGFTVRGIKQGFRIGFQHTKHNCIPVLQNMQAAIVSPRPVKGYLHEEVAPGRVAGPFDPGCMQGIQISRFGVIPKGSQAGARRLNLDLSHPVNHRQD